LFEDSLGQAILDVIQPKAFASLYREIVGLEERIQKKTTKGLRYAAVYGLSHVAFSLKLRGRRAARVFREETFVLDRVDELPREDISLVAFRSRSFKEFEGGRVN
jgi:hypothetical protein